MTAFFVSCPREMEELLIKEVHELTDLWGTKSKGGLSIECTFQDMIPVLYRSRIASRVFKEINLFRFLKEDHMYSELKKYPWENILTNEHTFKVQTILDRDAKNYFPNSLHLSYLVKDALCDRMREVTNERPNVDTKFPLVPLLLRVDGIPQEKGWEGRLYIDITGAPLSNRGYREAGHDAPLRENLAAAMIMATDWDPENEILVDPFCGTGTVLIEAALIKSGIAPSFIRCMNSRPFAAEGQMWFEKESDFVKDKYYKECDKIRNEAKAKTENFKPGFLFGSDLNHKALQSARDSLQDLGFNADAITFSRDNALDCAPPIEQEEPKGIIVTNPPYGERLGEADEAKKLFLDFGENLKNNWRGYRAYILASDPALRKSVRLQTSKRIPFFNGNLECRLIRYNLY